MHENVDALEGLLVPLVERAVAEKWYVTLAVRPVTVMFTGEEGDGGATQGLTLPPGDAVTV